MVGNRGAVKRRLDGAPRFLLASVNNAKRRDAAAEVYDGPLAKCCPGAGTGETTYRFPWLHDGQLDNLSLKIQGALLALNVRSETSRWCCGVLLT